MDSTEGLCFDEESESGITTPTSPTILTFACDPSTVPAATTPIAMSIPISTPDPPTHLLQVSPTSDLAGYSYETSTGRYATFFWQSSSNSHSTSATDDPCGEKSSPQSQPEPSIDKHITPGSIYASNFLKKDPSWVLTSPPTLVATNAKQDTPLAAVTWSNGLKAAVYYLDVRNIICERVSDNGGNTWSDGTLTTLAVATRSNSDLAASATRQSLNLEILVYFQTEENYIFGLRFNGNWGQHQVSLREVNALGGTSLACNGSECIFKCRTYIQSAERDAVRFINGYQEDAWVLDTRGYFPQRIDRRLRLGCCTDRWYLRLFAHDGSKVHERTTKDLNVRPRKWLDEIVLPACTGRTKILQNFIVLNWPADVDYTASEIHFFSMEEGVLWDYLLGPETGSSVHLITPQA